MAHTHDLHCIDGCGRVLGSVTLPDNISFKGDAHYGLVCEAEHMPIRREDARQESTRRRAEELNDLRQKLELIKAQDGFTDAYIDHDDNPQTPGVLKRIWNRIFGA